MSNVLRAITAEFERGVVDPETIAIENHPEIAIIGRSNVGKSSLINRLANHKKLARVSSTPGRTQEVNLFKVQLKDFDGQVKSVNLSDLPGFGYAKLSKIERGALSDLIYRYLNKTKAPQLVLILNDSKRMPEEEELFVRDLCFERDIPVLVVLTKCDRLKRNELSKQASLIAKSYGLEAEDIICHGTDSEIAKLWERVFMAIGQ